MAVAGLVVLVQGRGAVAVLAIRTILLLSPVILILSLLEAAEAQEELLAEILTSALFQSSKAGEAVVEVRVAQQAPTQEPVVVTVGKAGIRDVSGVAQAVLGAIPARVVRAAPMVAMAMQALVEAAAEPQTMAVVVALVFMGRAVTAGAAALIIGDMGAAVLAELMVVVRALQPVYMAVAVAVAEDAALRVERGPFGSFGPDVFVSSQTLA